jgi:hypothetical protein
MRVGVVAANRRPKRKWFQVTRFTARLATGMHGIEHCIPECRVPRLSAPRKLFSPASGSVLSSAPQLVASPERDRTLVTAFRSPTTAPAFTGSIPGSMFPACYFASSPTGSAARSALRLHDPGQFAPARAASTLRTRCSFPDQLNRLSHQPPLPFGIFRSLRIEAFNWLPTDRPAFRLRPISRYSPQPKSIASLWLRISASGPLQLRRLAVPQTSWNHPQYAPLAWFRQRVFVPSCTFSTGFLKACFHNVTAVLRCIHCG